MVTITWMSFCFIAIGVFFGTNARDCQENWNSYTDSCKWNGQVNDTTQFTGSDSNQPCFSWARSFFATRDVLLRLNVILGVNVSLQIIKYIDVATKGVLIGELNGCNNHTRLEFGNERRVRVALANSTGFALNFVGKPCSNSSKAAMTFYSTPSVSSVELAPCRRSPCSTNVSCLELENADNMGYRCYCKNWFNTSCLPGPLPSSGKGVCSCSKAHYVGEICNLNGSHPAVTTTTATSMQSVSFDPSKVVYVASTQSFQGTVAINTSTESGLMSAVEIGAGVAGGFVVVILLFVTLIICYRRCPSKASEHIYSSPGDTVIVHFPPTEGLERNVSYVSTGQSGVNNILPPTELEVNICYVESVPRSRENAESNETTVDDQDITVS